MSFRLVLLSFSLVDIVLFAVSAICGAFQEWVSCNIVVVCRIAHRVVHDECEDEREELESPIPAKQIQKCFHFDFPFPNRDRRDLNQSAACSEADFFSGMALLIQRRMDECTSSSPAA